MYSLQILSLQICCTDFIRGYNRCCTKTTSFIARMICNCNIYNLYYSISTYRANDFNSTFYSSWMMVTRGSTWAIRTSVARVCPAVLANDIARRYVKSSKTCIIIHNSCHKCQNTWSQYLRFFILTFFYPSTRSLLQRFTFITGCHLLQRCTL